MLAGDMQAAMQKLHTQDKPAPAPKKEPQKKAPPVKEPREGSPLRQGAGTGNRQGFMKSLFGKK